MTLALDNPTSTALRSSATIGSILPPLSPLSSDVEVLESERNRNQRSLFELDADDDSFNFYDLYESPCRGILRASNDELLDHVDLDQMNDDTERKYIISYNNGGGRANPNKNSDLYKAYFYYFDDIEYCKNTFFGGCSFLDVDALKETISSEADQTHSYVNFTVVYDYEIHYTENSDYKPFGETVSNDEKQADGDETRKLQQSSPTKRVDPMPALKHLETIVVEHLSEVVGLGRRECDPTSAASKSTNTNTKTRSNQPDFRSSNNEKSRTYQHDFSDEQLDRMLAISSEPKDVLDPDYANCMVPVASAVGETTECMPVTGGIRIHLNTTGMDDESTSLEDLELAIQSGFQRLIRFGMQQNLYVSKEEDVYDHELLVKYVSFIGTRVVPAEEDGDNDAGDPAPSLNLLDEDIGEQSNGRNGSVVGLVVASIGIIGVAGLLAAASTKEKPNGEANGDSDNLPSHVPLTEDSGAAGGDVDGQLA